MDDKKRYEQGMKVRRQVLGNAHVDRTLQNRDAFNEEFQDLITRYAWGEIWSRPGLPRQTRSMITLAMMVALNRGGGVSDARACGFEQRCDSGGD